MTTTDAIALAAAIIAGFGLLITCTGVIIAKAANAINRSSSLSQIAVAERELFLSLVERRTKWMDDYMEAFMGRQKEWRIEAHCLVDGTAASLPWERRLDDLHLEASWMFDQQIDADVSAIYKHQLKAFNDYWSWLRENKVELDELQVGPDAEGMSLAHEALGQMMEHMHRYLYVGDIQRPQRPDL